MTEESKEKTNVDKVIEIARKASPERLESMIHLFEMSNERAAKYGEALSLLIDSDYDITNIKLAIKRIKDERGMDIIKTRTNTRVFKFYKDEDNPSAGFTYRAFYVNSITTEQKIAIQHEAAERTRFFTKKGVNIDENTPGSAMKSLIEAIDSDDFESILTSSNKIYRKIVLENIQEVGIDEEGNIIKPISNILKGDTPIPEAVLLALEEDIRLLIDEQGLMGKNSLMADMLAF